MGRVLVACENSQAVTAEFRKRGHEAFSCDLLPCEGPNPEWHCQQDVVSLLGKHWDLLVAHPPCTYLSSSGMHWTSRGLRDPRLTEDAYEFALKFFHAPIYRIAIENPIGILSTRVRKPDQILQPYQFGDDASKSTCLWLKNLPLLSPTKYVEPRVVLHGGKLRKRWANQTDSGQNRLGPSEDRWKMRSKTYHGIAEAMADQWGGLL